MKRIVLFLVVLLVAPLMAHANYEGKFCSSCTSQSAAEFKAQNYAPHLSCYPLNSSAPMTPDNMQCTSAINTVILVHPSSGTTYGFKVTHEDTFPYDVKTTPFALSQFEKEGFAEAATFYEGLKRVMDRANAQDLSGFNLTWANTSGNISTATSCPDNTALATLVSPEKMSQLDQIATVEIGLGMGEGAAVREKIEKGARFSSTSVSVPAGRSQATFTANIPEGERSLTYQRKFNQSEVAGSLADVIVFNLTFFGWDDNHMPLLDIRLNKGATRIAGSKRLQSLLMAEDGPQTITNPCILEQLKKLASLGQFKKLDGSASRFGPDVGGPSQPDYGDKVTGCTIRFYNARGELQYVFSVPRSMC
ncbi:hypothetical protein [Pseudoalteromonas sp. UG3-2]